ncbi:hypothetical protein QT970_30445 [Microcoleus sp. herbarium8]|uniref:hypothetical protein n=1 Tax=Microcoleus sp. herbarium8 TaxID=3055436 RepID=UPI002FD4B354
MQKAFFDDSAITSSARTLKCKTPDAPNGFSGFKSYISGNPSKIIKPAPDRHFDRRTQSFWRNSLYGFQSIDRVRDWFLYHFSKDVV